MIDTIKFKIPVTNKIIEAIKFYGFTSVRKDNFYGFKLSDKTMDQILIPPFDTPVSLMSTYQPEYYYLECSLPKVFFGENLDLLKPNLIPEVLKIIYQQLLKRYENFIHYDYWTIQRIDMCYEWKFESQQIAQNILDFFKILRYPKKNYLEYKTSTMYSGKASTAKLYLKRSEFLREDYKKLMDNGNIDLANKTLIESEGVLRFEYEMRKAQILQNFDHKEITYKDIVDTEVYYKRLNTVLDALLGGLNREAMESKQVLTNLEATFDKARIKQLLIFYFVNYSKNPFGRYLVKKFFDQSTIHRYSKDLKRAKIGIPFEDDLLPKFDLAIPSIYEVGLSKAPTALAGGALSGYCNTA